MLDYPPVYSANQTGNNSYGYVTRISALQNLVKRKRYDISIWLQSGLSVIYATELVYYFIRLRSVAGARAASWRSGLMLVLLIMDIALIWLTVRSKKLDMCGHSVQANFSAANGVGMGPRGYNVEGNNPFATPLHRIGAHADGNHATHLPELGRSHEPSPYVPAPRAPEPAHAELRSHLHTPITG
ncbi:hypothetical protein BX661DRAFT_10666 [Kickxella alabastrina]|uniref:uncharacterized protein n=1 Tax=Kickxella alabastrina TaxID=61397 RepID=UPI00221F61F0|nr:uncharacterized protein BX661DRAFT_10666 [Kickxella alabastrina]KAI7835091.1 hypothetical protein BX661DRAFT_10666 [Kickxella alabastrina]KAJ1947074.1 hypothetical protein GGF37_000709 [Kickxella alabastrina]